jgi:hypothetical protein
VKHLVGLRRLMKSSMSSTVSIFFALFVAYGASAGTQSALNASSEIGAIVAGKSSQKVFADGALADGTYLLKNACDSNLVLSIMQSLEADGADATLWSNNNGANQRFKFETLQDGHSKITAEHSGRALDVYAAAQEAGGKVIQWAWHGGENQHWWVQAVPSQPGRYTMTAKHSKKVLDANYPPGSKLENGTRIQQWTAHQTCNQQWEFVAAASTSAQTQTIDLRPLHDAITPLKNPDKGWYHHLNSNSTTNYGVPAGKDNYLTDFPGMHHVYIRLPWSLFEPTEGNYDWSILDQAVDRWASKGLKIALRITALETGFRFATPEWVKNAGAKGDFYKGDSNIDVWEPDPNDPIFLDKLERFHKALGARTDGKDWLAYIDIGSLGVWGEGHYFQTSQRVVPNDVLVKHLDLHRRSYPTARFEISDDAVRSTSDAAASLLRVEERGICFRDDSVLVEGWLSAALGTGSIYNTSYFERNYRKRPSTLELTHYQYSRGQSWTKDVWLGANGADPLPDFGDGKTSGAEYLLRALQASHASYVGYHGWADVYLRENPEFVKTLLNRMGYWFFPHSITIPTSAAAGSNFELGLAVENRGVAPSYNSYKFKLRLTGNGVVRDIDVNSVDSRAWLEGQIVSGNHAVTLPADLPAGQYAVSIGLFRWDGPLQFALSASVRDANYFYRVGSLNISGVAGTAKCSIAAK